MTRYDLRFTNLGSVPPGGRGCRKRNAPQGVLMLAKESGDFGDEVVDAGYDAKDDGADGAPDAGEYCGDDDGGGEVGAFVEVVGELFVFAEYEDADEEEVDDEPEEEYAGAEVEEGVFRELED